MTMLVWGDVPDTSPLQWSKRNRSVGLVGISGSVSRATVLPASCQSLGVRLASRNCATGGAAWTVRKCWVLYTAVFEKLAVTATVPGGSEVTYLVPGLGSLTGVGKLKLCEVPSSTIVEKGRDTVAASNCAWWATVGGRPVSFSANVWVTGTQRFSLFDQ